ncbi:HNH endonuclease signature motif containing protein [Leifsonia poae]|uniref:HNH nuclease domain-containing protein n=1 Tax=Leifsonia poae TaxID=110933 RepID=A0A9W6H744_9MICO|nr:HNH endonuclease signature motif containing protein [Leifsonia poae]GLJ74872.1 hypothetical protein GCM10017584_04450 [Leifsonia poae]
MSSNPVSALGALVEQIGDATRLRRDELLNATTTLADMQAVLDALKVRVAGELVHRSMELGDGNPVTASGHGSAAALLAERWRIPIGAARQLCRVGDSTRGRLSLLGERLPATYPFLAAALDAHADAIADAAAHDAAADDAATDDAMALPSEFERLGRVSVDQAAVIVRELDKAAPGCDIDALSAGERLLVEHAPDLTVEEVRVLAGHVRDRLDDDGIEPREQLQHRRRSLTIRTTREGLTHIDWYLDPESAAYVVSGIDSLVGAHLRTVRFSDTEPVGANGSGADGIAEPRTLEQLRSDEATEVFRHIAGCTQPTTAGRPPVTIVVRMSLDALTSGVGRGEIDGVEAPLSASTVRRMAADANIIPVVLGAEGDVLDLGRARRLFSRAQKLALAERDGGCAWAGCPHPPSYTEAHHIRWWNAHGGTTDLDNGVLLCSRHHHRIHDDEWQIEVRDRVPYFIPPPHVDPRRRARRGGRIALPDRVAS